MACNETKIKVGFIFADELEFNPFRDYAAARGGREIEGFPQRLVYTETEKACIYAMESGVGKVNAALAALELIRSFEVRCILNAGLAGALQGLHRADIAAGLSYVECDYDVRPLGYRLGEKSNGQYICPASQELLAAALSIDGVKPAKFGCGDLFLSDEALKEEYIREFDIGAFDMESGAIAAACRLYDTPFLSLRKMSDDADSSAALDYRALNAKEERHLSELLMEIVDKLDF